MREKIMGYWQNLQAREKKILLAGFSFFILFLLYLLIESSSARTLKLKQDLEAEQELLTWIKPVVSQLLLTRTQKKGEPVTAQNILAQVEYSLGEVGLSAQIETLNLIAENQVRIEFANVVYESLVGWLYAFSKQGVIVREFVATKAEEVGTVQASVLLSAG